MAVLALRNRVARTDTVALSATYLLYSIMLGFFRIFWVIGETSGLFGKPPVSWVGDIGDILEIIHIVYTLGGLVIFLEVYRRMTDRTNRPIAPLILNFTGALLMLLFVTRVVTVTEADPSSFVTWASLTVNGVIRGGVYA